MGELRHWQGEGPITSRDHQTGFRNGVSTRGRWVCLMRWVSVVRRAGDASSRAEARKGSRDLTQQDGW